VPDEDIAAFSSDAPNLPAAYEHNVTAADTLADRRFDKAEAAGQIAVIARQIADAEDSLSALRRKSARLTKVARLEAQWQRLDGSAFEPLAPEFMLDGSMREGPSDLVEKTQWSCCADYRTSKEEAKACASLTAELASLGENASTLEGKSSESCLKRLRPSSTA